MQLIEPTDRRWAASLSRLRHDIYHLPRYVELSAHEQGGRPMAVFAQDGDCFGLLPLILRPLPAELGAPDGWSDATSPYGYPAPLLTPGASEERLAAFLAGVLATCAEQGVVALFVRLHPLLGLRAEDLRHYGRVVTHGRTVFVDLRRDDDALRMEMRKSHAYDIRRMLQRGFVAAVDAWESLPGFVRLYRDTMERVGAGSQYFFSERYFELMRVALSEHLHLCTVLSPEGEMAAAGLFSSCSGVVQYLFSGSAEAFAHLGPTKLVLGVMIRWSKEQGAEFLHLGGGLGAQEDGLFEFKAGFASDRSNFSTFRAVLDRTRYDWLMAQRGSATRSSGKPEGDFFPGYRG